MSRVPGLPIYAREESLVDSKIYNLWRRAKLHFATPIRLSLNFKDIVLVLEDREWVCVDETQNDMPVLAWVEFEDKGRDVLHEPVKCKLNHYHYAASKLHDSALEQMGSMLEEMLHQQNEK